MGIFMKSFVGGLAIGLVPGIIIGTIVYKASTANKQPDLELEYLKALNEELDQWFKDHNAATN